MLVRPSRRTSRVSKSPSKGPFVDLEKIVKLLKLLVSVVAAGTVIQCSSELVLKSKLRIHDGSHRTEEAAKSAADSAP